MSGFPVLYHLPEFAQLMCIDSVMPSNHLILSRLLLLSIFPSSINTRSQNKRMPPTTPPHHPIKAANHTKPIYILVQISQAGPALSPPPQLLHSPRNEHTHPIPHRWINHSLHLFFRHSLNTGSARYVPIVCQARLGCSWVAISNLSGKGQRVKMVGFLDI